ncbi:MAG: hypothetical protein ABIW46_06860 [Acidimicrobiales bacterium]
MEVVSEDNLGDRVLVTVLASLSRRGFRAGPGPNPGPETRIRPLGEGVESWVGLNRRSRAGQPVILHPMVGVRHAAVEAEVVRLAEDPPAATYAPTVFAPLDHWSRRYGDLEVAALGSRAQRQLDKMAEAIDQACVDVGARAASLPGLLDSLDDPTLCLSGLAPPRRAVVLRLLGRLDEALATMDAAVAELGPRHDPAAERTRLFARRFRCEAVGT